MSDRTFTYVFTVDVPIEIDIDTISEAEEFVAEALADFHADTAERYSASLHGELLQRGDGDTAGGVWLLAKHRDDTAPTVSRPQPGVVNTIAGTAHHVVQAHTVHGVSLGGPQ